MEWPCLLLFSTQKSCSESESRIMRFFCTAGRGTEIFAHKEISSEINNNPDSVCISLIYFCISESLWIDCQNSTVYTRSPSFCFHQCPPLLPLWPSYFQFIHEVFEKNIFKNTFLYLFLYGKSPPPIMAPARNDYVEKLCKESLEIPNKRKMS